jgi:hypothetical protein
MKHQRVIAYIDGLNLFYSSLKGSKNKWLDIAALSESLLLQGQELIAVKYFSALVGSFKGDISRSDRQRIYFEALCTNPKIEIKLGHFSVHKAKMPLAKDFDEGRISLIEVVKTEEKGTDVNLAVQMAIDAKDDKFDYAMLFSNDSDMAFSIQIAAKDCGKKIGLYIDHRALSFKTLKENVLHIKRLSPSRFAAYQFPDEVKTSTGRIIRKPKDWY